MPTKRRLEDLYVRGDFLTLDDGKDEPVTVWVGKLNPIDTEKAVRKASAARARVKASRHDRDGDEFAELWEEVLAFETEDQLVEYLVVEPQMAVEQRVEAQLATEEEWAHDGYLQGLRDAWEGGLKEVYIADPDSDEGAEAKRVLGELQRFADEAALKGADEIRDLRDAFEAKDLATLREEALERVIQYRGSQAWLDEFHRCEVFYGTYNAVPNTARPGEFSADLSARYWRRREDFDRCQGPVLTALFEKYAEISVDVMEGKGSEGTPTSSDSSGSPSEPATGVSSGPAAVAP